MVLRAGDVTLNLCKQLKTGHAEVNTGLSNYGYNWLSSGDRKYWNVNNNIDVHVKFALQFAFFLHVYKVTHLLVTLSLECN